MVHWGGHDGRAAGPGVRSSWCGGAGLVLVASLGIALAVPATANAQSAIGFQGGLTVDPEQVFGGVYYMSGDIGRGIHVRPGVDGATGDGLRIATIALDLVYGYPLNNGWTLLAGGGPSVVVTRLADVHDYRDTSLGFQSIFGFGHESGFFVEARLGSLNAQRLMLGVGWAIELK